MQQLHSYIHYIKGGARDSEQAGEEHSFVYYGQVCEWTGLLISSLSTELLLLLRYHTQSCLFTHNSCETEKPTRDPGLRHSPRSLSKLYLLLRV